MGHDDFEAEDDLRVIIQSKKVHADASRMARAHSVLDRKQEDLRQMRTELGASQPKPFNRSVRNTKMNPGG